MVQPVELGAFLLLQFDIAREWLEKPGNEGRVYSFEEFEEEQADAVALARKTVTAAAGELFDQSLSTELGQVIAKRSQAVLLGGSSSAAKVSA